MSDINENREIAIKLSGVKKQYKLGQIGGGTLTADLQSWWARKRGKEDPNTKIGSDQRLIGKTFMALNGIDLTVYKGEALGIIGGNGAGKSTMLKLLSRVTAPSDGEIDIYGRITSMLEVGTGFNGELTGRENVYMNGAILGMTKAEIDAKMEDIIEFSEVREFIDTPVKRYSSGMYVKLAFSVAAHLDSEIMIMDEVLAVGDMAFQKKCLDKMRDAAKKEGRTVLYVSHNMNTIRQLCDRCIVLDQGKIVFEGDVEEGIGRYLHFSKNDSLPISYDLSTIHRNASFGSAVLLKRFDFITNDRPVFAIGEKINFKVTLDSNIEATNIHILLPIRNGAYHQVGVSISEPFEIKIGTNIQIEFSVSFSELSGDLYCLDIGIIELDNNGDFIIYDNPGEKILFEINDSQSHSITWKNEYWGNVLLSPLQIIKIHRC